MSNIVGRLRIFLKNTIWSLVETVSAAEGLRLLRERLAGRVLVIGAGIGILALPISFLVPLNSSLHAFLTIEVIAYTGILLVSLVLPPTRAYRSLALVVLAFGLGLSLLLRFGPDSVGDVWLFTATIFGALFFGARGGLVFSLLDGLAYAALALLLLHGRLPWTEDLSSVLMSGLNVAGLGLLASLTLARIVTALGEALLLRERLSSELSARGADLEREVRDRRSAEGLLEYYRDYDRLTGLPNRESFVRELSSAVQSAGRRGRFLAVLSLGIDRFKRVNEARGHDAGDAVLVQAAAALRTVFRDEDVVARFGDERFAVLCRDVKSAEEVKDLIETARRAFRNPFYVMGAEQRLIASVGLALFPNDGEEPMSLLRAAETALRLAEEAGAGSYRLFDQRLQAELVERLRLEAELEDAVRKRSFEPWFQARVDGTGRFVGAEALARWPLPDGSVRVPLGFVPIAERSGDIAGLGRVILHKACEYAARWERDGRCPIPISVNISPYQFRNPALLGDVRAALTDSGLSPYRLELEVTESGLAEDEDAAVDLLASLKALGLSLSIDDFGTGYSSIAKLRDYPVDMVKLPRELVEPLPEDPRAAMIAEGIIELAHNLQFGVVAEGVETQAQFSWLKNYACDQYQGFLFARPLPFHEFEAVLAKGFVAVVE